ncbi:RagB/SusD family nutrient uptake outer membrane protein [Pseudobacter ginsenosidimutans]|uniref:SusD-like starch-binding protein associating with outer membrane n=1 Tax=Pseudobacter ginsenosidimutans TaxID=661488 RepID=A0A4V2F1W8_9BACT|nr:RagB/SusD family nutrient uptake outer membrane protein [Pseudobacter ginsenosidimutans]RZS75226.1 SusD-like starch-binding protein associating with outer membrane [Pseudobacter ginsenosidimutans]
MHTYMNRKLIPLLCLFFISTSSCKKFLSTYSQNKSFVESAADLDEVLVGDAYYKYLNQPGDINKSYFHSMDDDAEMGKVENAGAIPYSYTGFHYWQAEPRMDINGVVQSNDPYFIGLYNKIARINTILQSIPDLRDKGEPAAALNRISGEAHFLRAMYYYILVNLYGKPYNPSSAGTDFGVPLRTDPTIKDQFIARSSTRQVYDQIIADLLDAEKELEGANQTSTSRANQAAAQALLCRVYLYTGNYEKTVLYADKVINTQRYPIKDLNNHTTGDDFLTRSATEVIFTMGGSAIPDLMRLSDNAASSPFYRVSDELATSYSPTDLRRQAFFIQSSKGYLKAAKKRKNINATTNDASDNFLLRISEVYLNRAEALASTDQFEEARNSLQELRKNRFKPADLTAITTEGAALMSNIREERRLDLCFEFHRWFDLRRYAVNAKYPFSKSIKHKAYANTGSGYTEIGYYELSPYAQDAAAYIVPIPNDEIEFNRGMLINEPRPGRPLKQ